MTNERLRACLAGLVWLGIACRTPATNGPPDDGASSARAEALAAVIAADPEGPGTAWARRDLGRLQWVELGTPADATRGCMQLAEAGDTIAHLSLLAMAEARLDAKALRHHAYALLERLVTTEAANTPDPTLRAAA